MQVPPEVRPRLRGRLHQVSFFVTLPLAVALVVAARRDTLRIATSVYAASLIGLFASSAAYHRGLWSPKAMGRMRRLDHSMIYLLIAGTSTPIGVMTLHGAWRVVLLTVVWAGAATGIALKLVSFERLRVVGSALYIILGWVMVLAAPQVIRAVGTANAVLIAAGGVLYTSGAVVLLRRRPNPNPRVFGYHEVWHSMVIAASLCHYGAIFDMVRSAT